jgi:hypothetical protein
VTFERKALPTGTAMAVELVQPIVGMPFLWPPVAPRY